MAEENPLAEVQRKKVALTRQLIQVQGQIQMKERVFTSTKLTIAEIDKLPANTKTYRTVGRM